MSTDLVCLQIHTYMYKCVCVLNEMKMWEALVIDNILSMVACSRNDLSVCSINQLTD